MFKKIAQIVVPLATTLYATPIMALDAQGGADAAKPNSTPSSLFGDGGVFPKIANLLIFLVGALAVIMLIWGGLQYVISAGDSKRVESAKNTILYSIIGIVVAILAYAIVNFVVTNIK